jgi:arabinofuranosyltransferase
MRVPMAGRATAGRVTAGLTGIPLGVLAAMAYHHRWMAEDASVYFRVVANLQDGLGPVWNAGERVEAYTGPLWLAVLWLGSSVLSFVAVEWIAVALGALATVAGCAAPARGSWLLWRTSGRSAVGLPLGLLVLAALPPMWEFATSGLETGMIFLWLGGCFWALAGLVQQGSRARPALIALLIGLGPLVRPDLGVFAIGFMVALLASAPRTRRMARLRLVGWALLVPAAYQVFRMGYFAALEPNAALAKEAALPDWSRGWTYLAEFVEPYLLFIPLALLFVYAFLELRGEPRPARAALITALAPMACGLLHALYIVRLGGDFMHARMLLPSLFGLLLPLAVVIPLRRTPHLVLGLAVIPWAIACAATLRSNDDPFGTNRGAVTLHDYHRAARARNGLALRRLAETRRALVLRVPLSSSDLRVSGEPRASSPTPVVAGALTVGLLGYAAGPRVHVVDQLGVADPLGSRTELDALAIPRRSFGYPGRGAYYRARRRQTAGHEKYLPSEWVVARFGPPGRKGYPGIELLSPSKVAAARRALRCPPMKRLLRAVSAPLTAGRFLSNIGDSFSLTTLRFPADPSAAEHELCAPDQPADRLRSTPWADQRRR